MELVAIVSCVLIGLSILLVPDRAHKRRPQSFVKNQTESFDCASQVQTVDITRLREKQTERVKDVEPVM